MYENATWLVGLLVNQLVTLVDAYWHGVLAQDMYTLLPRYCIISTNKPTVACTQNARERRRSATCPLFVGYHCAFRSVGYIPPVTSLNLLNGRNVIYIGNWRMWKLPHSILERTFFSKFDSIISTANWRISYGSGVSEWHYTRKRLVKRYR